MVDRGDPSSVVWAPPVAEAAPCGLCTDCGLSRSSDPKQCGHACQFIKPDYPALETRVHGRPRDTTRPDEIFFGPFRRMVRASLVHPREGSQWTGIATRIGEHLLETGTVDAVLTMAPDPNDKWKPMPVLVTSAEGMAQCRGMRMGYAPLLALLEPARARGFKRLAVIGIPCQVYALRALEKKLGFEKIFVIGTPCSDNNTTANFHQFLDLLADDPDTIIYLEFRADYHVESRFSDGCVKEIPFLQLPISKLPPDFFPMTCRTCVGYTDVLADITVGYMGGQGEQWLLIRNERGEELLGLLGDEVRTSLPGSAGKRAKPVKGLLKNVTLAAGGLPLRSMPNWLRPIVGWLMPKIGPRGDKGSFMTLVHQTIMDVRSLFNGLDESVLPGLIDGEKRNASKYDDALQNTKTPADIAALLTAQRGKLVQKIAVMDTQKAASERAAS
jgi:coenzyme F420 hydrogenase subunit beta